MGGVVSCMTGDCLGSCLGQGGASQAEEEAAATKIQAAYRGNKVRKSGSGSAGGSGQGTSFEGRFD